MALITFDVVTPDPEDAADLHIARMRWPVLPRIGDTLVLHDIPHRADEDKPEQTFTPQIVVTVVDVRFTARVEDSGITPKDLDDIEVVVESTERASFACFKRSET